MTFCIFKIVLFVILIVLDCDIYLYKIAMLEYPILPNRHTLAQVHSLWLLLSQPRVTVTSCFVYNC